MQWSIALGRIGGIEVRLHVTFLLLLVWIGVSYYAVGGVAAAISALAFIGALFGSVLLHELGHAFAARRYGVRTPDITLLPIGGVARLDRIPDSPRAELAIALAGPAVNIVLAAVLYVLATIAGRIDALGGIHLFGGTFLGRILFVNLWLALFNLLPAFPMDGGRVLRAALAHRLGFARATQIAAGVGQAFAFVFALLGFFFNPMLLFIALFVYLGAASEVPMAQLRDFAQAVPVHSVMVTRFHPLRIDSPLSEAVEALLAGSEKEFPVVDQAERVVGMLCREDIIRALTAKSIEAPVGDVMQAPVPTALESEMLESAFQRMLSGGYTAIPVVNHWQQLVGLLTRDNVAEVMMVQSALPRQPKWT